MSLNIVSDLLVDPANIHFTAVVGEGSYGQVWKAEWGLVTVAVKKLFIYSPTPQIIQRLEKEITLAAKLRHPTVVYVYGICLYSPSEIGIVMEYVEEGSLFSILSNVALDLPWSLRWKWARQAVAAVSFLHEQKVVHRDIKSLNFLVSRENLKITDFGMSTAASMASNRTISLGTMGESKIGTVRWLAPECSQNKPIYNEKTDIYGLGMVLWEIASRKIPFEDIRENAQVIALVKYEELRPDIPEECPTAYSSIIKRCWDALPANRPTAVQLIEYFKEQATLPEPEAELLLSQLPENVPSVRKIAELEKHQAVMEVMMVSSWQSVKSLMHLITLVEQTDLRLSTNQSDNFQNLLEQVAGNACEVLNQGLVGMELINKELQSIFNAIVSSALHLKAHHFALHTLEAKIHLSLDAMNECVTESTKISKKVEKLMQLVFEVLQIFFEASGDMHNKQDIDKRIANINKRIELETEMSTVAQKHITEVQKGLLAALHFYVDKRNVGQNKSILIAVEEALKCVNFPSLLFLLFEKWPHLEENVHQKTPMAIPHSSSKCLSIFYFEQLISCCQHLQRILEDSSLQNPSSICAEVETLCFLAGSSLEVFTAATQAAKKAVQLYMSLKIEPSELRDLQACLQQIECEALIRKEQLESLLVVTTTQSTDLKWELMKCEATEKKMQLKLAVEQATINLTNESVTNSNFNNFADVILTGLEALVGVNMQWKMLTLYFQCIHSILNETFTLAIPKMKEYEPKANENGHSKLIKNLLVITISDYFTKIIAMATEADVYASTYISVADILNGNILALNPKAARTGKKLLQLALPSSTKPIIGVMAITIISAKDLKCAKRNGTVNPYAIVANDKQQLKTPVVTNNTNPMWHYTFKEKIQFDPTRPETARINVSVWDKGSMLSRFAKLSDSGTSLYLGEAIFTLPMHFTSGATFELSQELASGAKYHNVEGITGCVTIKVYVE